MNVPPGQTYHYSALPSKSSIRLLQILSKPEEPINCSLKVIDLDHDDRPLYDCLSYTWGDPLYEELFVEDKKKNMDNERKFPIDFDGETICVTANLNEALKQLSMKGEILSTSDDTEAGEEGFMWIDAICINQEDMKERSAQVGMMTRIYREAEKVIVWLGPDDLVTESGIEVMNRLSSVAPEKRDAELHPDLDDQEVYEVLGIPFITSQKWLALATFLLRTWFKRIWVLQETFVAKNVVVLCGSHTVNWENIIGASRTLNGTRLGEWLTETMWGVTNPRSRSTRYVGNTMNNHFIFQEMRENAESLNLEALLVYSRYFGATMDEDRVYAIMGVWPKSRLHQATFNALQPAYSMSVEQVYTIASMATILEMGDLNVLSLVEDSDFRNLKGLPSWVPDYSLTPFYEPLAGNPRPAEGEERWSASKGLKWEVPVQELLLLSPKQGSLPVKGINFDRVAEIAANYAAIMDEHQMYTMLEILPHFLRHGSPQEATSVETFWRTLIKDTFRGKPAEDEDLKAFQILIIQWIQDLEQAIEQLQDTTAGSDPDQDSADPQLLSEYLIAYTRTKSLILELSDKDKSGLIPSWNTIQDTIEMDNENLIPDEVVQDLEHMTESFRLAYLGRRLFRTQGNYLGIASQSLEKGDAVWVLAGAAVPIILRPLSNGNWKLVGEAYVHGIMNGEAVKNGAEAVKIDLE